MKFTSLSLKDAYKIEYDPKTDERGSFFRTYCRDEFRQQKIDFDIVQTNYSITAKQGAVRGLHFQKAPFAEAKLIRCVRGKVFDVMVDLRSESPTYRQWFGYTISDTVLEALFLPAGFAHGFQTLSDVCHLEYAMSNVYNENASAGIRWDDPQLCIEWPLPVTTISEKDKALPTLI